MPGIDDEYADLLRQYRDQPTPELRDRLHARYVALREAELLGGTTSSGLPYPDPSDPVAGGADAIRALAEALDPTGTSDWLPRHMDDRRSSTGRVFFGTGDDPLADQTSTLIALSPVGGNDEGQALAFYIIAGGGTGSGRQLFAINKDGAIVSTYTPYASATGMFTTTVALAQGEFADYTVTFPSGRFTKAPRVTFGAGSVWLTVSHQQSATTTSMTVRVYAITGNVATGRQINWNAQQFNSGSADG